MQFPMHDLRTRGETGRLKCTVILSFVVTGLAFTLLGYAIGRSHNLQSGRKCDTCVNTYPWSSENGNVSSNPSSPTPPSRIDTTRETSSGSGNVSSTPPRPRPPPLWNETVQALIELGCRPVQTKVPLKDILNKTDSRWDFLFNKHVAVSRCCDFVAYCGDPFGVVEGTCEVKDSVTKEFFFPNITGGEDVKVEVEVHLECECVS